MKILLLAALILPLQSSFARATAVSPRSDLYHAANGAWLAATAIPADKAEVYGADLPGTVNRRVLELVHSLAAAPQQPGTVQRKIADYFDSHVDTAAIERAGLAPMRATLGAIEHIATAAQLAAWQGQAQGQWKTPVWLWGGFADFKDPERYRALAMQGGLGMPERDYYLKTGEARIDRARAAYLAYLARLAQPEQVAARVLALETRIAAAHLAADQAMNPARVVPSTAQELSRRAPGFDWAAFLAAARLPAAEAVNVVQIDAAVAIARLTPCISRPQTVSRPGERVILPRWSRLQSPRHHDHGYSILAAPAAVLVAAPWCQLVLCSGDAADGGAVESFAGAGQCRRRGLDGAVHAGGARISLALQAAWLEPLEHGQAARGGRLLRQCGGAAVDGGGGGDDAAVFLG